jgi:hypothetical protein
LPKGSWKLRPTKGIKGKWVRKTLMASPNFYESLMYAIASTFPS